jgi:TolB-like protein/DNA-binding winged helix-turn-helix (wHTH) protein/Tfp pilus assembly protein PilF
MGGDFRVGPWLARPSLNSVSCDGTTVRLEPKVMEVLVCLAAHPGETLPKDELIRAVWANTFVGDDVLVRSISELRRALEDDAKEPRFIQTIPKRGYRLVAPVVAVNGLTPESHTIVAEGPAKHSRGPRLWFAAGVVLGVAGLLLGSILVFNPFGLRQRFLGIASPPPIQSLAVLPLKNLSDDPAQNYFSYALTEELITDLAQISGLKVISHTSVMQYAGTSKPLPQVARELGVDGIVEGTVQRSGNRVRITAQLIYAPQERHLWAASYDRDLRDVLALESSVAAAIVEPIRAKTAFTQSASRKASASLDVLENYLRGKYAEEQIGAGEGYEGYKDAIKYFKLAIEEDPTFAPAYVELARTYDEAFDWRANDKMPLEKAAVKKALELDPELADAHLMNAGIKISYDCDLLGAGKEYQEAIRINPNLADAHHGFSDYLDSVGRPDESIREAQRAKELDPEGSHLVGILVSRGQYDRAVEEVRKHLELRPKDGFAYIDERGLISLYHLAGRHREEVEALQQAWTLFGFEEIGKEVGKAYAVSGYAGALQYSAKQLEHLYAAGKLQKPDYIASWYARSGDKEQALKWLRIDFADNNQCWDGLDNNPDFDLLHGDPRFQELVNRMPRPH